MTVEDWKKIGDWLALASQVILVAVAVYEAYKT
jgi:hypothetical protein